MRDLLVDAANALRDVHLAPGGRANWARVDALLVAWSTQVNADSDPILICDQAVFRDFANDEERVRWREMSARGQLIAVPEADSVLLERAQTTGAAVLSRDCFAGWQRTHGWILESDVQFWDWYTSEGHVVIRSHALKGLPAYDLTKAEERDERKARGFGAGTTLDSETLWRLYRCVNRSCPYGIDGPLTRIPQRSSAGAKCPVCGRVLVDIGPRPRGRRLKLVDADGCLLDLKTLADEQVITLGRSGKRIWSVADFVDCPNLSREHVEIRVRGGQVVVKDLESTNGTWIEPWNPQVNAWDSGVRISAPVTLLARDRIRLPGPVFVEQSARQYVVPDYI